MKVFKEFIFEKFDFDKIKLKARFFYSFDNLEFFEEIIDFNNSEFDLIENIDEKIINNILFHLHIALWISYYKLFPTKNLVIKSWFLDETQIIFWHKFYLNWLWEFFIKNDFDFENILKFTNYFKNNNLENIKINNLRDSNLLMWGGWKDSIVSSILLDQEWNNFDTFVFWKIDRIKQNTLKILWKKTMLVRRELSKNLFKLNKQWYYNWHVPITWIIAFVSLVSAYLYDYKNIVLSNEKSADEWNTVFKWLKINHQYSKSSEFENDFRNYVKSNIWDINYYSKLRNIFELEIAKIFSKKAQKYFKHFSSCNNNFKIIWEKQKNNWCLECEKCAFVYLILSPNIKEKEIVEMFWENLLDKKTLENTYKQLLWFSINKPFECVWTYDESKISFEKTLKIYKNKIKSWIRKKLPYILSVFEKEL